MNQKQYLAIDIGGTSVKLGVVDETGAVLAKAEESVSFDGYETPVLTTVLKAAKAFVDDPEHRREHTAKAWAFRPPVRSTAARASWPVPAATFPTTSTAPIQAELKRLFGLPVTVANDANCMLLGEVWAGAAKGYTDVIGVTLGTGVGGGILTGGHFLEGARGLGGELGHYRLHALDGVAVHLRGHRLLGAVRRHHGTGTRRRGKEPRLEGWPRHLCCRRGRQRDRAVALLDPWTDEIAQGLAGMVHIFNPQLILIGGGVSAQQKLLIEPIAAKVRASVMPAFAEGLEVRAAQLHNDAGMVGAVYYFRQQHSET